MRLNDLTATTQYMLLTIITINYNNKSGLQSTFESVFNQSYHEYEYIVIDGGSTDGSKELIIDNAARLTHWVSEPDRGIYHAMNKGILKATGTYCLFLNSGDSFVNNSVLTKIFAGKTHEEDILYGDFSQLTQNGVWKTTKLPSTITVDFMMNATICHQVAFIKRDLFTKYGLYDDRFKISADYAFFFKTIVAGNVTLKYLDEVISVFVADGISSKQSSIPLLLTEKRIIHQQYLSATIHDLHQSFARLNAIMKSRFMKKCYLFLMFSRRLRDRIINFFKQVYIKIYTYRIYKWLNRKKQNYFQIPIIINNRNRYTYPTQLISFLEQYGYHNIFIIDNASTYPPLLQYYETTQHKVFRLYENVGFCALWDTYIFDQFKNDFYVYTDPDVIPVAECPPDFMQYFLYLHKKYNGVRKVGFSLAIDDLPDHFSLKQKVVEWEKQFFVNKFEPNVFDAPVDTTFALYKPGEKGAAYFSRGHAIRTGYPYTARHMPWYENTDSLDAEAAYYLKHIKKASSHWSEQS